jgi:sugar lactone lactonase YvrE
MVRRAFGLVLAAALLAPPPAIALPDCSPLPEKKTILSGRGRLESIISDARGRIYFTDLSSSKLMRLDAPGAPLKELVANIQGPGGLDWNLDGSLLLGFNGGAANPPADGEEGGFMRVDPETGKSDVMNRGMGMANGVVRGPDGALYGSNDIAGNIDRVFGGKVEDDWAKVEYANGLVIDTAGRYMYAAQTFRPASVARVEIAHPENVTFFFEASGPDIVGGPDGMTRDDADRLFLAVNGLSEVWRIDRDGTACALARGIQNASAVNWGGGGAFPRRNLYVTAFSGVLVELPGVTDKPPAPGPPTAAARPALHLTVSPTAVSRRTVVRFRFLVRTAAAGGQTQPVPGATVRLGNKRATTNAAGRATIRVSYFHPGRKSARALLAGYRSAATRIRVR